MMKNKLIFQAYTEWGEIFDLLDNEQAGRLVKHLFAYVRDQNPTNSDKVINLAFISIKQDLKRDLKKWLIKSEANTTNGAKGGRPRKNQTVIPDNPINPTVNLGFENKPKKGVKVKVKDKVIIDKEKDITNKREKLFNQDFESFIKSAFKYLGKSYTKGNPASHTIEAECRRWLMNQNPSDQVKNLAAYVQLTEAKFRSKTISSLLTKLGEYNYTQDLTVKLNSTNIPVKSKEEIAKNRQEELEIREAYRKQREGSEFTVCSECQEIECDCTEDEKTAAAQKRINQIKKNFKLDK